MWILDAAWGWSAGGWLTLRFGFHDSIASGVVHGVAGAFTLGVLFNLGPRIGKYTREGLTRAFRPHNLHITALGLMLIFTGFYAFYGACLVIASTSFPGWANIYLSPTTLGSITMVITMGFAGGFTGGYFASRGDPFWTISGGLAGVIGVSAGADVYAPTLAYLIAMLTAVLGSTPAAGSRRRCASTTPSARSRCTASAGFLGMLWVGVFAAGYPTGLNNVESTIGGQLVGHGDVPAARLPVAAGSRRSSSRSSTSCACRSRSSSRASTWPSTRPTSTPSTRRARGDRRARRHARRRRRLLRARSRCQRPHPAGGAMGG